MSKTNYTPPVDDNLLGLTSTDEINQAESFGVIKAEQFILDLSLDTQITPQLVHDVHKQAFGHLYDWAGKYRTVQVNVGDFLPPSPQEIPMLMYHWTDEVNFRRTQVASVQSLANMLAYAHHKLVYIHPYLNGNGRTARIITNLLAHLHGYQSIQLYHRIGPDRALYVSAIKKADEYDYKPLEQLILTSLQPF